MTAGVVAAILVIMAGCFAIWWLVDRWLDRAISHKLPPRAPRPPVDHGPDLEEANDFLHGNCERRTRIALARDLPDPEKNRAATF